ncbi:MAG: coproporphyrinogen III oxidase [Leptolyngbyaceae cyanobacterium SL_1_1]|nr:coproporphyrinogen III oxidase [Leptolyngbyaceae cyanobacterium RM1_1_2]NJO12015.1 coproporphyrinogen III oxidase [Leptolyngbyaceae cyanobacterium SL_1_1]
MTSRNVTKPGTNIAIAQANPTAAYLHIPFCRRRCYYCDFPISVLGDRLRGETSGTMRQYADRLCQEIQAAPDYGAKLETVFFGGGTPSLLAVEQLQQLLLCLKQRFGLDPLAEISMEIDPGTFDLAHIQGYQAAGINRVSLGVQAFQPEILSACGRTHTAADIDQAVDWLHQADIKNYSLDLISGLPHQTIEHWQASLERAIALQPQHISIYDLTIEPNTAFGKWYQPGVAPLPSDDRSAAMYRLAQQVLTQAGFDHYEISNYARPGYQCRHNRVYWQNRPYYGFGMGATSYLKTQRFGRPRKLREYYRWVDSYQQTRMIDCPPTPPAEQLLDGLMVGLRLAEGIDLAVLNQQFGSETVERLQKRLRPYIQQGWVEIVAAGATSARLRLSDPEGFLFSNVVLTALFEEFD